MASYLCASVSICGSLCRCSRVRSGRRSTLHAPYPGAAAAAALAARHAADVDWQVGMADAGYGGPLKFYACQMSIEILRSRIDGIRQCAFQALCRRPRTTAQIVTPARPTIANQANRSPMIG